MAMLHTCFAVGCCSPAGRLVVAHCSLLMWSIAPSSVGSGALFYWSPVQVEILSVHTAEVLRNLG